MQLSPVSWCFLPVRSSILLSTLFSNNPYICKGTAAPVVT